MREIVSIFVGQAGIQVGNAIWELFCLEHGIELDGKLVANDNCEATKKDDCFKTFFSETNSGIYSPRSLYCDLDNMVNEGVKSGALKSLFHPKSFFNHKEDGMDLFPQGYHSLGKEMIDNIHCYIRNLIEACDSFQGFSIFHGIGGGAGAGLGSLILEGLERDHGKKSRFAYTIFPSPQLSNSNVDVYNSVFAIKFLNEFTDAVVMLDNEAIYDMCAEILNNESPNFNNLNSLIAQVVSSITASMRFDAVLNTSLDEIITNLVPYANMKFLLSSYAPVIPASKSYQEELSIAQITNLAFNPSCMMVKCNPSKGKYMACCLMYRGDVVPKDVNAAIAIMKSKQTIDFVSWSPTGFKFGINSQAPTVLPGGQLAKVIRNVCMISNTTSLAGNFSTLGHKFDTMYDKRAFIHWFIGEGMDGSQFYEARDSVAALVQDYKELEAPICNSEEEDD